MTNQMSFTIEALDSSTHCFESFEKLKNFTKTLTRNLYDRRGTIKDLSFIPNEGISLDEFLNFKIKKKLGEGAFSEVFHAVNEKTGEEFAIRLTRIDHSKYTVIKAKKEIQIYNQLKLINNKNVCKIFKSKLISNENEQYLQTITELGVCSLDIVLKSRMEKQVKWSEAELLKISFSLINALAFVKNYGINHRDISLNNIILSQEMDCYKLIDFGEAYHFTQNINDQTLVGKISYLSPQILKIIAENRIHPGDQPKITYDLEKADVFALGIVLLSMANLEFVNGTNQKIVSNKLMNVQKQFPRLYILLCSMLCFDEDTRKRFSELKHLFVNWEKEIFETIINEIEFIDDMPDTLIESKNEINRLLREADFHKKNCLYIKAIEIYMNLYKIEKYNNKKDV